MPDDRHPGMGDWARATLTIVAVLALLAAAWSARNILMLVMTKAIDLSAPTVIITLLIGSSLAGLAGPLIALPIAAAHKVIVRELRPGGAPTTAAGSATSGAGEA